MKNTDYTFSCKSNYDSNPISIKSVIASDGVGDGSSSSPSTCEFDFLIWYLIFA